MNNISVDIWHKRLQINCLNIETGVQGWKVIFNRLVGPLFQSDVQPQEEHESEVVSELRLRHPILFELLTEHNIYDRDDIEITSALHEFSRLANGVINRTLPDDQSRTALLLLNQALPGLAKALQEPWMYEAQIWLLNTYCEASRCGMGGTSAEVERLLPYYGLSPKNAFDRFVGRRAELDQISALVTGGVRMVTIAGLGGIGKTALLQAYCETLPVVPRFVDLREVSSASSLIDRLADLFQLRYSMALMTGDPTEEVLMKNIGDSAVTIALDNCEDLGNEAKHLLRTIQASCPNVTLLATSREPLGIPNETLYSIPPLAVPEITDCRSLDELEIEFPSVSLFLNTYRVKGRPAIAADEVVRRLAITGGLPLDIEIVALLADDLIEPADVGVRPAIKWATSRLQPAERAFLAALTIFPRSFTTEASQEVSGSSSAGVYLSRLSDLGLIESRESRWQLYNPVREWASKNTNYKEQHAYFSERHAEWAERELFDLGPQASLGAMIPDIELAIGWWANKPNAERAIRVAVNAATKARQKGMHHEAEALLRPLIDITISVSHIQRAEVLDLLGRILLSAGRQREAQSFLETALETWRSSGKRREVARSLSSLGVIFFEENTASAEECFVEAVATLKEIGDITGTGATLSNLAALYMSQKKWTDAEKSLLEAADLAQQNKDLGKASSDLIALSEIQIETGFSESAKAILQRAMSLALEANHAPRLARSLALLSYLDADAELLHTSLSFLKLSGVAQAFYPAIAARLPEVKPDEENLSELSTSLINTARLLVQQ